MNRKSNQLIWRLPPKFDPWAFAHAIGIHPDSTKEFTAAIEIEGEIVAVLFTGRNGDCFGFDIAVSPDHQRAGYGSTLMDLAIDEYDDLQFALTDLEFCLDAVNPVAVKMLKQRGFEVTQERPGHTYMTRNQSRPLTSHSEDSSMPNKIAQQIKKAKCDIYRTLPKEFRVLRAMTRIASTGRRKKAFLYNDSLVTRMVRDELRKAGVETPKVDWGKVIMKNLNAFRRRWNIENQADFEELASAVIENLIMGETVMRTRSTGKWKQNLVEQIDEWVQEGKSGQHMSAMLATWVQNKAENWWTSGPRRRQRENESDSFMQERRDDNYEGREVLEEVFNADELTRQQLNQYMGIVQDNPQVRSLIKAITRKLEGRNDELGLLWKAYLKSPDAGPKDLNFVEVETEVGGFRAKAPLYQAMGWSDPDRGKMAYRIEKLRKLLKSMSLYSEIEEVLMAS